MGMSPGTAMITATTLDGGLKATCYVTVASGGRVPVTGVTLNKASTTLATGRTETLTATVLPINATNKGVTWWSSSDDIATVSNGVVTAREPGAAMITVTTQDGGMTATCNVTVYATVTRVYLDKTSMTVPLGWRGGLTATIEPWNATNKNVKWSSGNAAIAEVNANGSVIGRAAGTATITATTEDGGKTATCRVTVSASRPAITAVATGLHHTLVIMSDGSLWAWGYNGAYQVGDGTYIHRNAPVQVGSANDWKTVIAGGNHSLAIKADGSLWAWGYNGQGQLGDGTDIFYRNVPAQIGSAKDWVVVTAGCYHTIAIKSDGSLWAWGNNEYEQLGDGTKTNRNVPVQVGSAKDWATVIGGAYHTLALKTDSSLWAWGSNNSGSLGNGTYTSSNVPVQVGDAKDWSAVTAGTIHTIAIKSDGSLWAWGYNGDGQLGDGTYTWRNSPVPVGTVKDWALVTAGDSQTLTLKSDGSLWAWGSNKDGRLGIGDYVNRNIPTLVGPLPASPVTSVGLNKTAMALFVGASETLTATVLPANATYRDVYWTSSDASIATVSSDGLVRGVTPGTALITAMSVADGSKFVTCEVTVNPARVEISMFPKALFVSDSGTLRASALGLADDRVTWSASHGTISSATGNSATYTASASVPAGDERATITATSVQTPTISGQAKILIRSLDWTKFDGNSKTNPQLLDLANAIGSASQTDLDKYDINGDGKIDDDDLWMLFKAMGW
jgi:uncharacterized protein YjdB